MKLKWFLGQDCPWWLNLLLVSYWCWAAYCFYHRSWGWFAFSVWAAAYRFDKLLDTATNEVAEREK